MKTDALSDLIRTVGEHKAIYHLWSALDDIIEGRHGWKIAKRGMAFAASALEAS